MNAQGKSHPDPAEHAETLRATIAHTEAVADAQAVIENAIAAGDPKLLDPEQPLALIVPAGATAFLPDLSAWRAAPSRRTGTYRPATVEAFETVTTLYADEATTVWVHPTSGRVVAVFDDNCDDSPGWGQHRAQLDLQPTPEWAHWIAKDGQLVGQEEFALHLEAGLQEIEQPDAADMLEMAQSFRVTNNASFRSSKRLASGEQQFMYDEKVEAAAGRTGELTVPATFILLIAPFVGEPERQVVAKLRYRMGGGSFQIGYKLERPDKVVRDALDAVAERVSAKFPRTFVGEPA